MGTWTVEDAVEELSRSLRASTPGLPGDRGAQEWRALRHLAERHGILEPYRSSEWETDAGGREHRCVHVAAEGVWYKATHKNQAGYYFDFEDGRL